MGREISEMIQAAFQDPDIPSKDCRGQGYDNGAITISQKR